MEKISQIQLIDNFINKVKELYSPEVGDFKRKVILYTKRLKEDLNDSSFDPFFEKITNQVICNNNMTVTEDLRSKILESIFSLRSSLNKDG